MIKKINPVFYQLALAVVFLIHISITTSMSNTLPAYIILSSLPFIWRISKVNIWTAQFIAISFFYALYGVLFQDAYSAMVCLFAKFYQFIIFFVVFETFSVKRIDNLESIIIYVVFFESLIGLYLLGRSDLVENDVVRITAGRQPVGGNLSIVSLPLFIYSYFSEKSKKNLIIVLCLISGFWIFRSTIRGYMLLYFLSLAPVFYDYFIVSRRMLICLFCGMFLCVMLYYMYHNDGLTDFVVSIGRFEHGTGSRDIESKVFFSYLRDIPYTNKIFGIGFGGNAADYPEYLHAVTQNTSISLWEYLKFTEKGRTFFHNLYFNILLAQGVLGLTEVFFAFLIGLKKIKKISFSISNEKKCMYLFWIGFFVMNAYRWSCDCGIAEMIIFALILKMIEGRKSEDLTNEMSAQ